MDIEPSTSRQFISEDLVQDCCENYKVAGGGDKATQHIETTAGKLKSVDILRRLVLARVGAGCTTLPSRSLEVAIPPQREPVQE